MSLGTVVRSMKIPYSSSWSSSAGVIEYECQIEDDDDFLRRIGLLVILLLDSPVRLLLKDSMFFAKIRV
ncbi:MAG: hypothetical protein DMG05_21525 [Acidobacteria bacterium]|nr:MAG: hypothetical protein DMG05_21525 [Acidobacteriota bacterium]